MLFMLAEPQPVRDVWTNQARYERVIDGDSIEVIVDLGFGIHVGYDPRLRIALRVLGVDTPEINRGTAEERARAAQATEFTRAWPQTRCGAAPDEPWPIHIRTQAKDSFGRYLADVWCAYVPDASLAEDLLSHGLAVVYQ
jgi:micrococcal nuclease